MNKAFRVALVRDPSIEAAVERGLALVGGIERFVQPGADVVIKVNMFTQAVPETAKVTHPAVVLAIARLCHGCGAKVSVIERRPYYDLIFRGYEEIEQVATLVALEDVPHRHRHLPGARSLVDQVPWPDLVDRCDVFINLPGLRTHALTKVSNGMKNLMGLLPDEATRLVHHYGLDGSICDLNSYRPSDLVITDAVYTLEGNFPSEGSPVKTDLITVADNVVAADLVAARLMDVAPEEIFYLQEAIARGLGPASLDQVALLGDDLEATVAQMRFEQAPRDPEPHRGPFHLYVGDVCASCRQALAGGLLAVSHRQELAHLQGVSIVAGHHPQTPSVGDDRVLIYGNCAYRYRHLGHYEPGCPPLAGQVARGLTALAPRTIWPAICSIAWREEPIERVIPKVAEAGYVGLELWGPHVERYLEEHGELDSLAELLDAAQLQVPMLSGYYDLAVDPEVSLERAERYVRYAQRLGAPLIRVFSGGGDSARASIATWRAVTAGLERMCALGLDARIGFALETHDGRLHDTTPTTLRLLRQVNAPNLWVNLDIFNLFAAGEDPLLALERLMPWVRIVHLKNGVQAEGRWRHGVPLAAGAMDYGAFLDALDRHNYGGFVSIEWFGPDPDGAAASELAYLRQALAEALGQRPAPQR